MAAAVERRDARDKGGEGSDVEVRARELLLYMLGQMGFSTSPSDPSPRRVFDLPLPRGRGKGGVEHGEDEASLVPTVGHAKAEPE